MIWLQVIVGSRTGRIVAGVSAAILILSGMITLWERGIRNQVLQEVETQNLQREVETRKRVDEAVRDSPRDFDHAVDFLRQRQPGK